MIRSAAALTAIAAVIATPRPAADRPTPGDMLVLGEGSATCGEYVLQPEAQRIRMDWILGYLSGANSRAPAPYKQVGHSFQRETFTGWLQGYCNSHGLDTLAQAAEALRRDYYQHEGQVHLNASQNSN